MFQFLTYDCEIALDEYEIQKCLYHYEKIMHTDLNIVLCIKSVRSSSSTLICGPPYKSAPTMDESA